MTSPRVDENAPPWVIIPDDVGRLFQTLSECDAYIEKEVQKRNLNGVQYRYPDHLVHLVPTAKTASDSAITSDPAVVGTGMTPGAFLSRQNSRVRALPTRRSFLVRIGGAAAIATSLLLFGWAKPQSASAACSCTAVRYLRCYPYSGCPRGGRRQVATYNYTYDTLGGCDVYCSTSYYYECCIIP